MEFISEESLVHKQVLSPDSEHFLHINLLHSIGIELWLAFVPKEMLLETYLVQIHIIQWNTWHRRMLRIVDCRALVIKEYFDKFSLRESVLIVHADLLLDLQFVVNCIIYLLIWIDDVYFVQFALIT